MPSLPTMPDLAPFIAREQFHALVERGTQFYISAVVERTGSDPKGAPKQELVYTVFAPEIWEGPGAFSLGATGYRRAQMALILGELPNGTVGPCVLKETETTPGQKLYTIEPAA